MAKIVGIGVKIEEDRFKYTYLKNSGQEITTDGIKEGWETLKNELNDDFVKDLKQSPYYLRGNNEQYK